jgi:sulfite exporter TauE/SafE/copper chaperone CopZ
MNKTILPIKGMHCRSCEILLEEAFSEVEGVKSVRVEYKQKIATVYSLKEIPLQTLEAVVRKAGYGLGKDKRNAWLSSDSRVWKSFGLSLLLVFFAYFIARYFHIFNLNFVGGNTPSSLGVVFLIGLTAGLSSCMALVGGLILGISARHAEKHPDTTTVQKFRPHIFFNLGRIVSYALLGGVIGLAGKAFQFSGLTLGVVIMLVALVMTLVGLQLTGISPRISNFSFAMPTFLAKFFRIKERKTKEYSHVNAAMAGALTFFLPCGFTQSMQLYAMTTGSFVQGALIMAIFALGTTPGLLSVGGLASVASGKAAKFFFRVAGIVVISMAVFNFTNGYHLSGLSTKFVGNKVTQSETKVKVDDSKSNETIQIINMKQGSYGYSPKSITIKKGVLVRWVVTSTDQNTCAASLYSDKLNINANLKNGENIFEFTPTETGSISFSCSMGMYRGSFTVVE